MRSLSRLTLSLGLLLSIALPAFSHAGVRVLVLGSSNHFDAQEAGEESDRLQPGDLAEQLERILNRGANPGANEVVFEEVYRSYEGPSAFGSRGDEIPTEFHCHSLAQYYFWPEGRKERLQMLSGKDGQPWDYVVLIGDPYLIAHMPGIYAEGAHLITEALRVNGDPKITLLLPWLKDEALMPQLSDAVHRVGQGMDIPIAPAGETFFAVGSPAHEDAHYLAAAAVFSALSGQPAWGNLSLAQKALASVIESRDRAPITGDFSTPSPFTLSRVDKDLITFNQTGTSSEAGIKRGLLEAAKQAGITLQEIKKPEGEKIDFNYGRGNTNYEKEKQYKVDPDTFDRSYGFPMQDGKSTVELTLVCGIDKRYFNSRSYNDGTDLGIAYDMCREEQVGKNVRCIPIRLLWSKISEALPQETPLRDNWHMSRILDAASGAYLLTLLTGKDTAGPEPGDKNSPEWKLWKGRDIGHQTALRMGLHFPGQE